VVRSNQRMGATLALRGSLDEATAGPYPSGTNFLIISSNWRGLYGFAR
jgi:hypothetical protein